MEILCRYYTNNFRLGAGITGFVNESGFRFFCLEGSIVKSKQEFKVVTPTVTVYVTCVSRETGRLLAVVLTSNPKYKQYNNKPISLDLIERGEIFHTLCHLMVEKCTLSGNPFTMELCNNNGESYLVSATAVAKTEAERTGDGCLFNVNITCNVRNDSGEVLFTGENILQSLLNKPLTLRSFEYTAITHEFEKTISVKRSRGEILREISHYLGKTVVLISTDSDGNLLEQYVSATSVLECTTKADNTRFFKKISPVVLRNTAPFCIYLTSASVIDITKEQSRALGKSTD